MIEACGHPISKESYEGLIATDLIVVKQVLSNSIRTNIVNDGDLTS